MGSNGGSGPISVCSGAPSGPILLGNDAPSGPILVDNDDPSGPISSLAVCHLRETSRKKDTILLTP